MTTTTSTSSLPGAGRLPGLTDLYASATRSLLAQNPGLKNIDAQLRRDDARLSSLGKLALALDDLRAVAAGLSGANMTLKAGSSGKAVDAALSGAGAAAGVHTVEVRQLAQGQQLVSKTLPAKDAPLGTGAATVIRIETGSGGNASATTLRIEEGENTLEGVAKAMRAAGLDAQLVQDGKGYALSLTGKSGAANGMRISVSGDPVLTGLLSYQPGASSAMTQKSAPRDAQLTVDGKSVSSATNKVDGAIPGVSLTLHATGKNEVKVAGDASAIAGNVKSLVGAFNTMNGKLAALRSGDADSDAALAQVGAQLARVLDGADARALAEIGITRKSGGLALDEARLSAAIARDPDAVVKLFAGAGSGSSATPGLAGQLASGIAEQMASGSTLARQAAAVKQDMDKLVGKKDEITTTVNRQAAMLVQQYALAGAGGSTLFGSSLGAPMSAFDFLA